MTNTIAGGGGFLYYDYSIMGPLNPVLIIEIPMLSSCIHSRGLSCDFCGV